MSEPICKSGTYRGRLESKKGNSLKTELRLDFDNNTISADFFLPSANPDDVYQQIYYSSMRANLLQSLSGLIVSEPIFIFDKQQQEKAGGYIELEIQSEQQSNIRINCIIPETIPQEYTGDLIFASKFFRELKIKVGKLEKDYPWPPEFITRDIPENEQPKDIWEQNLSISIKDIFRRSGIDATVELSDKKLPSEFGLLTERPLEDEKNIRWDDRELHELMQAFSSGQEFNARDWCAYLLIVSLYDGGIEFDKDGRPINKESGLSGQMFDKLIDPLSNPNPRQGAAVFWKKFTSNNKWFNDQSFFRTIIHELGHVLNLPHSWEPEIGRANSISFMNSPFNFQTSGTRNYWQSFRYTFDTEEVFHIYHGFYNEVVPGGNFDFLQWTSSSVFRNILGLERSDLSLTIIPSRSDSENNSSVYQFTEPVIVKVTVKNNSDQYIEIGDLSPAYHNLKISILKPNKVIEEYKTPVCKCSDQKIIISSQKEKSQIISLSVNSTGFTFDMPGQYEIIASLLDPRNNAKVVSRLSITIKPPNPIEEEIANRLFNQDASLFLYMKGGNHLTKAKEAFLEIVDDPKFANNSIVSHAKLVLGLNEMYGQKRIAIAQSPDLSNPEKCLYYLEGAFTTNQLPIELQARLKKTIKFCSENYGVESSVFRTIN